MNIDSHMHAIIIEQTNERSWDHLSNITTLVLAQCAKHTPKPHHQKKSTEKEPPILESAAEINVRTL